MASTIYWINDTGCKVNTDQLDDASTAKLNFSTFATQLTGYRPLTGM